jgi:hypothetical protein
MLLAMGTQPTSGYCIELDPNHSRTRGKTLWLSVKFKPPEQDFTATILTSPCVIFTVKRDTLTKIVAVDTGLSFQF